MEWFYSENGKQAGPVNDGELDELLRSGRIDAGTLVWREGMKEWQPLKASRGPQLPMAEAPPVIDAGARAVCVECRREFPHSEMIVLNRSWVCGECKPIFVQRLKEGAAPAGGEVWRVKRQFVLAPATDLPDRCIKCNAPAHGQRLKRQLYWHHPGIYLIILLNLLIYAIVAICVRKKAMIHIGVCERHRRQRVWTIAGSWLAVVFGILLLIVGINVSSGGWAVFGVALFLGGAIYGALRGPLVAASKIDPEYVWVRGGGREFLDSLPDWPGPR